MKILKVAVGNSNEAFIEDRFTEGLNIKNTITMLNL